MKATISCMMMVSIETIWEELQKIDSLMEVASPILYFSNQNGEELFERWEVEQKYSFDLFAFKIVPLGKHVIEVKSIDSQNKEIRTHEHGSLTKIWNHTIRVEGLSETTVHYTDEIEIRAGILTIIVWAFAHFFYRHRQRKWRKLLQENSVILS